MRSSSEGELTYDPRLECPKDKRVKEGLERGVQESIAPAELGDNSAALASSAC